MSTSVHNLILYFFQMFNAKSLFYHSVIVSVQNGTASPRRVKPNAVYSVVLLTARSMEKNTTCTPSASTPWSNRKRLRAHLRSMSRWIPQRARMRSHPIVSVQQQLIQEMERELFHIRKPHLQQILIREIMICASHIHNSI